MAARPHHTTPAEALAVLVEAYPTDTLKNTFLDRLLFGRIEHFVSYRTCSAA